MKLLSGKRQKVEISDGGGGSPGAHSGTQAGSTEIVLSSGGTPEKQTMGAGGNEGLSSHYPPGKCNAPRPQFFSTGCVSSTDSGTDTDYQLFGLGSKAGPHIGPDIGGSFGTQKAGYFFRTAARAPATFCRATIFRRETSQKPKKTKIFRYNGPS